MHHGLILKFDGLFEIVKKSWKHCLFIKASKLLKDLSHFPLTLLKPYIKDEDDDARGRLQQAFPIIQSQFEKQIDQVLDQKTHAPGTRNQ